MIHSSFLGEGLFEVKTLQAGNYEYNPVEILTTFSTSKFDQTITFTLADTVYVNDILDLTATASSELDVS